MNHKATKLTRAANVAGSCGILVAGASLLRRLEGMGAKYLPSIKDLKGTQRFLQQQRPLPKFAKPAAGSKGKRGKKK